MKTINSMEEINTDTVENILQQQDANRQPCWYVEFDKVLLKWKAGVKSNAKNDEYSFAVSSIKNYKDDQLNKVTSLEFAVSLLNFYRDGGKKAVKEWISDGCP